MKDIELYFLEQTGRYVRLYEPQGDHCKVKCPNYFLNFKHVNTKYRGIEKKAFQMEAGAQLCLYNGDCLKTAKDYVVITEGEFDALSWMAAGFAYSVSVPNGAANNTAYLDPHIGDFEKVEKVYIAGDQDHVGYNLALTLADRLGREKCVQVRFPVGIKDSNECLQKYGLEQGKSLLKDAFANAQPFPIEGVESVFDNLDEAYSYLVNGYPETLSIGIPGLEELITLFPSEVTIFTGA
ncbi:MAG: toprim domain-containing protein, partial [Caulobacteraceae bacterium]|nr:toprim domain-containing protein [Caulobacteraceae bacterium]